MTDASTIPGLNDPPLPGSDRGHWEVHRVVDKDMYELVFTPQRRGPRERAHHIYASVAVSGLVARSGPGGLATIRLECSQALERRERILSMGPIRFWLWVARCRLKGLLRQ